MTLNLNIIKIISDMDEIFQRFLFARSLTPYVAEEDWDTNSKGCVCLKTAPLYQSFGFHGTVCLSTRCIEYKDWHATGSWINKSIFIHIFALLDGIEIVAKMNKKYKDKLDIDAKIWHLFTNLRHVFAHSERYQVSKNRTKENLNNALELQKDLYPDICDNSGNLNLDIKRFIIPFYLDLVEVLKRSFAKPAQG